MGICGSQHLLFCAADAAAVHLLLRRAGLAPAAALAGAAAASALAGIFKEVGDGLSWWPGRVSGRDLAADLAGALLAAAAIAVVESRRAAARSGGEGGAAAAAAGARYSRVALTIMLHTHLIADTFVFGKTAIDESIVLQGY
jgi:hypothetical protein